MAFGLVWFSQGHLCAIGLEVEPGWVINGPTAEGSDYLTPQLPVTNSSAVRGGPQTGSPRLAQPSILFVLSTL